jgi:nitrogen regulatory protein PII
MDFALIMIFVDDTKTEKVIDAAREAGATGATIVTSARGVGLEKSVGILGLELLNIRNVILVLAEKRRADHILEAVCDAGELDERLGTGVALQLDVSKAVGLREHIKQLEMQIPLADHDD